MKQLWYHIYEVTLDAGKTWHDLSVGKSISYEELMYGKDSCALVTFNTFDELWNAEDDFYSRWICKRENILGKRIVIDDARKACKTLTPRNFVSVSFRLRVKEVTNLTIDQLRKILPAKIFLEYQRDITAQLSKSSSKTVLNE